MNTSFDSHIPDSHTPDSHTRPDSHTPVDALEAYSMGKLPDEAYAPLEEHLLICPVCQTRLEAIDAYICVVRAACAALSPASNLRTMPSRERLSVKPAAVLHSVAERFSVMLL
jgi:anti-sigma factor RsiW